MAGVFFSYLSRVQAIVDFINNFRAQLEVIGCKMELIKIILKTLLVTSLLVGHSFAASLHFEKNSQGSTLLLNDSAFNQ